MASVHTELENTPKVKTLFEITKGKSLFSADSRIAYSGDVASSIDVIPVEYQKDKSSLKFSGAKLTRISARICKPLSWTPAVIAW